MQVLSLEARGFQLLLPVNMVAQITGHLPLTESGLELPGFSGTISWREFDVPLFRSSALMGGSENADDGYERVVVLWPMTSAGNRSFVALTSLGPPRVADLTDQPAIDDTGLDYALGCVALEDGMGVIPDIDRLAREAWLPNASPETSITPTD